MSTPIRLRVALVAAVLIASAIGFFILAGGGAERSAHSSSVYMHPSSEPKVPLQAKQQGDLTEKVTNVQQANLPKSYTKASETIRIDSSLRDDEKLILDPKNALAEKTSNGVRYRPGSSEFSLKSSVIESQARKLQKYLVESESKRAKTLDLRNAKNISSILIAISPPNSGELSIANDILLDGLNKMPDDAKPYLLVEGKRLIHEYLNTNGLYRILAVTQEYRTVSLDEPPEPSVIINQFFSPTLEGIKLAPTGFASGPAHVNTRGKLEVVSGIIANLPQRYRHLVGLQ